MCHRLEITQTPKFSGLGVILDIMHQQNNELIEAIYESNTPDRFKFTTLMYLLLEYKINLEWFHNIKDYKNTTMTMAMYLGEYGYTDDIIECEIQVNACKCSSDSEVDLHAIKVWAIQRLMHEMIALYKSATIRVTK